MSVLDDQLAQVERDLSEIDGQVAAGELDLETAERLRATYRGEADGLRAQLASQGSHDGGSKPQGGRVSRRVVGITVFGLAAVAILILAAVSLTARPAGGSATGGVAADVLNGEQPDLDAITNEEMEAVVAANPEVIPMRLALARRYFDAGEFTPALDHYMIILDTEQNPEALANVGWMTYLSGRPDVAATFVEESLARDPSYLPAIWFLANIRFEGLDDPVGAREPLEQLIAADDVPDDVRGAAEAMLEEVRSGS